MTSNMNDQPNNTINVVSSLDPLVPALVIDIYSHHVIKHYCCCCVNNKNKINNYTSNNNNNNNNDNTNDSANNDNNDDDNDDNNKNNIDTNTNIGDCGDDDDDIDEICCCMNMNSLLVLSKLCNKVNEYIQYHIHDYPWYQGGDGPIFGVHTTNTNTTCTSTNTNTSKNKTNEKRMIQIPHLRCYYPYGNVGVTDEWYLIGLLLNFTKYYNYNNNNNNDQQQSFDNHNNHDNDNDTLYIECLDLPDGQLLLIQGAEVLPTWVDDDDDNDNDLDEDNDTNTYLNDNYDNKNNNNNTTCQHRCWIVQRGGGGVVVETTTTTGVGIGIGTTVPNHHHHHHHHHNCIVLLPPTSPSSTSVTTTVRPIFTLLDALQRLVQYTCEQQNKQNHHHHHNTHHTDTNSKTILILPELNDIIFHQQPIIQRAMLRSNQILLTIQQQQQQQQQQRKNHSDKQNMKKEKNPNQHEQQEEQKQPFSSSNTTTTTDSASSSSSSSSNSLFYYHRTAVLVPRSVACLLQQYPNCIQIATRMFLEYSSYQPVVVMDITNNNNQPPQRKTNMKNQQQKQQDQNKNNTTTSTTASSRSTIQESSSSSVSYRQSHSNKNTSTTIPTSSSSSSSTTTPLSSSSSFLSLVGTCFDWVWITIPIGKIQYAILRTHVCHPYWSHEYTIPSIYYHQSMELKRYTRSLPKDIPHIQYALSIGIRIVAGLDYCIMYQHGQLKNQNPIVHPTASPTECRVLQYWASIEQQCTSTLKRIKKQQQQQQQQQKGQSQNKILAENKDDGIVEIGQITKAWYAGPNESLYDISSIVSCPIYQPEIYDLYQNHCCTPLSNPQQSIGTFIKSQLLRYHQRYLNSIHNSSSTTNYDTEIDHILNQVEVMNHIPSVNDVDMNEDWMYLDTTINDNDLMKKSETISIRNHGTTPTPTTGTNSSCSSVNVPTQPPKLDIMLQEVQSFLTSKSSILHGVSTTTTTTAQQTKKKNTPEKTLDNTLNHNLPAFNKEQSKIKKGNTFTLDPIAFMNILHTTLKTNSIEEFTSYYQSLKSTPAKEKSNHNMNTMEQNNEDPYFRRDDYDAMDPDDDSSASDNDVDVTATPDQLDDDDNDANVSTIDVKGFMTAMDRELERSTGMSRTLENGGVSVKKMSHHNKKANVLLHQQQHQQKQQRLNEDKNNNNNNNDDNENDDNMAPPLDTISDDLHVLTNLLKSLNSTGGGGSSSNESSGDGSGGIDFAGPLQTILTEKGLDPIYLHQSTTKNETDNKKEEEDGDGAKNTTDVIAHD